MNRSGGTLKVGRTSSWQSRTANVGASQTHSSHHSTSGGCWIFQRPPGRPGRRPGGLTPERGLILILVLGSGLGLSFLRSQLNLSILAASRTLAENRRAEAGTERDVDAMRVVVERLGAIDRIEPEGRRAGLERPPAEAVMLLAARAPRSFPGARPLGVPGAGVLGRWFERAVGAARVPTASASSEDGGGTAKRRRGDGQESATDQGTLLVHSACRVAGEHGERGSRCEACRTLAAGESIAH